MSNFITITKNEFENFLPENFNIVDQPNTKEIVYEFPTKNPRLNFRVYSSVDIRTQDTRDLGRDAIRCVLVCNNSNKSIDKGKRTHRMSKWKERLKEKLDVLQSEIDKVVFCEDCGSAMKLHFKNGKPSFYGCLKYPNCKTTMSLDGKYRRKIESKIEEDKIIRCLECSDGIMSKRSGTRGEFYGCSNFYKTGCKGTRTIVDVETYGHGVEEINNEQPVNQESEAERLKETIETFKNDEMVDVPSEDSNVKLIETKEFPHLSFKFEKFNPVQSRVFQYYNQDINLIVAAATSAGKTTVAEMLMSNSISQGKKTIFLSPLKAVSQEKYEDWIDDNHDWSKLNVSIVTGDYQLTDKRVEELRKANVIIMTTEMMDSRTRRIETEKNDWLLDVGTLVCDESHLLMMKGRGDKVESAVMRFTKQNPNCRIVFLSATMPNVSQLAEWLTSLNNKKTELINSSYRPCQLDIHYVRYNDYGRYQEKENNKINEAVNITQEHPGDKFIIFVHAKNTGRKIYSYLKDAGEDVEIHNAELTLKNRIRVSKSFKKKDGIRIIVATSTLAWGINLPARRVIIVGVHRGLNEVEPLDIKQESGRAGRIGFDPKGDAHILLPDRKFDYYKNWCENIPSITSTMNSADILAFHIVSEISDGDVYNVETLMSWYNRSLAAFQNNFLDRIDAEELLDKLVRIKILENNDGRYKITQLGRVAAHLYFSPYSIAGWYFNFSKIFNGESEADSSISWALANIKANIENYIPKESTEQVSDYKRRCNLSGLTLSDGTAWIGYCLESCLTNSDSVRPEVKNNVKFDIERTITALQMIDSRYANWDRNDYWKKLELRVQYEVSWDHTELCILKWVGGKTVRRLFDAEITTVGQLKSDPEAAVGAIGETIYRKILQDNGL